MKTLPNDNAFAAENVSEGLTKREYFTAIAMQGLLAANGDNELPFEYEAIAEESVDMADALISALNKKEAEI
jgi:hypothetical protein